MLYIPPRLQPLLKWLLIGLLLFVGSLFVFAVLIALSAAMVEKQSEIIQFGRVVDNAASHFIWLRLSIASIAVVFWKELVMWYGRIRKLNRRQVFVLKSYQPYVIVLFVLIELGMLARFAL